MPAMRWRSGPLSDGVEFTGYVDSWGAKPMKLASLKEGGRDGRLVVVSRDLTRAVRVREIAPTLQAALDDWAELGPRLAAVSSKLNRGGASGAFAFDPRACAAPLPRAYQWADGSAYVNHVDLVRRARGADLARELLDRSADVSGRLRHAAGPTATTSKPSTRPMASISRPRSPSSPTMCRWRQRRPKPRQHIRLLMLVNDVSLRNLIPGELAKGFGFFQSKPASAFSPVAVTPDELGGGLAREQGPSAGARSSSTASSSGGRMPAIDMTFDFARLIAHAARTRRLAAGSIIGSGTISNREDGGPGRPVAAGGIGYACIAEQRSVETITRRQAVDALPVLRRPGAHRDAG